MIIETHVQMVALIRQLFFEQWPREPITDLMADFWLRGLEPYPILAIQEALDHTILNAHAFPPKLGDFRELIIKIINPSLSDSSVLAWERVFRWCVEAHRDVPTFRLTENERRALKAAGGSWDVVHGQVAGATRKTFCEAFEALQAQEKQKELTLNLIDDGSRGKVRELPYAKWDEGK